MKKLIVVTAAILCSIVSMGEPFYLPETSYEHLDNYVLKNGETAWLNDDGEPVLLFGNGSKQPYTLTLNRSLKIQNTYSEIGQSSLSIEKDPKISFANGSYVVTNTATSQQPTEFVVNFVISSPPNTIMGVLDFDYTTIDFSSSLGTRNPSFDKTFNENTCTLKIKVEPQTAVKIWNFTAKLKQRNTDYENDLTGDGSDVIIRDAGYEKRVDYQPQKIASGSSYRLSQLRSWVANLYSGNHGEDWAKHKAKKTVMMNGYNLNFSGGTHSNYTGLAYNLGTLYWYQKDSAAFFVNNTESGAHSADISANATLRITDWKVNPSTNPGMCVGSFEYSGIANFNTSALKTLSTYDLADHTAWMELAGVSYTVTETNATTHAGRGTFICNQYENYKTGFYKLKYIDLESQIFQTVFTTDVIVKKQLVLKSPDGNYWAISVNNSGQLETTQYTKAVPEYGN